MDIVVEFIKAHMLLLYLAGAVLLLFKFLLVSFFRGVEFDTYILSFLRFYSTDEIYSTNIHRRSVYMWCNNFLNYIFFICVFIMTFYSIVTMNVQ